MVLKSCFQTTQSQEASMQPIEVLMVGYRQYVSSRPNYVLESCGLPKITTYIGRVVLKKKEKKRKWETVDSFVDQ